MRKKIRSFTVEGIGAFPLDMLRYDECYPCTQGDVAKIAYKDSKQVYRVSLGTNNSTVTSARWESFGWRVIEIETM